MIDVFMSFAVVLVFAVIVGAYTRSYSKSMRSWLWIGFAEYIGAAVAQLLYTRLRPEGGDVVAYGDFGKTVALLLDENFSFTAPELTAMFFQQPSVLDVLVDNPGTNTGSMHAISGWLIFILRGSEFGANFAVCGLSYLSVLSLHRTFRLLYPEEQEERLFIATVMIPSIPFWTSGLYKEAFCVMGFALFFSGWGAWRRDRYLSTVLLGGLGLMLVYLFRPPMLGPLFLGVILFYFIERTRSLKGGASSAVMTPVYFGVAIVAIFVLAVVVGRFIPAFSLNQVSDTVSQKQGAWVNASGGSSLGSDTTPTTPFGQVLALPAGLFNALFRPQFFDVTNPAVVVSAAEMTTITWVLIRAIRRRGVTGVVAYIRGSPFLTMCAIITIVGCALVGLVTRNLGSLARYRTPFFPFYGSLIISLAYATSSDPVKSRARATVRDAALARALARRQALRDAKLQVEAKLVRPPEP